MFSLYGLFSPKDPDQIRYIGWTARSLPERYVEHFNDGLKAAPRTKREKWIASLHRRRLVLQIKLLETALSESEILQAEVRWIDTIGLDKLVNGTPGGTGGATHRGKRPPEFGESIKRGQSSSPYWHERMFIGQIRRDEQQAYVEKRRRERGTGPGGGVKPTAEQIENIRRGVTGLKRSDEAKANYRASWTPERRVSHSAAVSRGRVAGRQLYEGTVCSGCGVLFCPTDYRGRRYYKTCSKPCAALATSKRMTATHAARRLTKSVQSDMIISERNDDSPEAPLVDHA